MQIDDILKDKLNSNQENKENNVAIDSINHSIYSNNDRAHTENLMTAASNKKNISKSILVQKHLFSEE